MKTFLLVFATLITLQTTTFGQIHGVYKDLELAMASPESVIKLDLKEPDSSQFASWITLFTNQVGIKIQSGTLTSLPEGLGALKHLITSNRKLSVNNRGIQSIPAEITQLQNLKMLDFRMNYFLKDLPENIDALQNLRTLFIKNTSLAQLEETLVRMQSQLPNYEVIDKYRLYFVTGVVKKIKEWVAKHGV